VVRRGSGRFLIRLTKRAKSFEAHMRSGSRFDHVNEAQRAEDLSPNFGRGLETLVIVAMLVVL